ncbi:NAD(P)-binding protein [Dendrothele bispora CBS 962.96]|uniref:NAD(P)-binding protein n=1 Tax=Dendrothele bispora (strain CBS 962.96) TaxID=1314807 RepID=A0A4S8MHB4_DENBC|nr:NAD(P)-binding protein [Dendrothele bispora CBS 962.96]
MRYYCANKPLPPPPSQNRINTTTYRESHSHLLERKYYEPLKIVASSKFPQAVSSIPQDSLIVLEFSNPFPPTFTYLLVIKDVQRFPCRRPHHRLLVRIRSLSRSLRYLSRTTRESPLLVVYRHFDELRDKGAKVFMLDVTVKRQVFEEFVRGAIAAFGQVDILINNAGQALTGAIEENTLMKNKSTTSSTPTFSASSNLTCAFLPHFRQRQTGTIVNISSQGADLALLGAGIYCASKAALDCVTEVWSKELAPFNIRALSLGLGAFRTDLASKNVIKSETRLKWEGSPYGEVTSGLLVIEAGVMPAVMEWDFEEHFGVLVRVKPGEDIKPPYSSEDWLGFYLPDAIEVLDVRRQVILIALLEAEGAVHGLVLIPIHGQEVHEEVMYRRIGLFDDIEAPKWSPLSTCVLHIV